MHVLTWHMCTHLWKLYDLSKNKILIKKILQNGKKIYKLINEEKNVNSNFLNKRAKIKDSDNSFKKNLLSMIQK